MAFIGLLKVEEKEEEEWMNVRNKEFDERLRKGEKKRWNDCWEKVLH